MNNRSACVTALVLAVFTVPAMADEVSDLIGQACVQLEAEPTCPAEDPEVSLACGLASVTRIAAAASCRNAQQTYLEARQAIDNEVQYALAATYGAVGVAQTYLDNNGFVRVLPAVLHCYIPPSGSYECIFTAAIVYFNRTTQQSIAVCSAVADSFTPALNTTVKCGPFTTGGPQAAVAIYPATGETSLAIQSEMRQMNGSVVTSPVYTLNW